MTNLILICKPVFIHNACKIIFIKRQLTLVLPIIL